MKTAEANSVVFIIGWQGHFDGMRCAVPQNVLKLCVPLGSSDDDPIHIHGEQASVVHQRLLLPGQHPYEKLHSPPALALVSLGDAVKAG